MSGAATMPPDACRVRTAVIRGIEALPVSVEVSATNGLPGLTIVGMPDAAVLEARSRVRCALRACGYTVPRLHVTVNLSPAELKKTGTGLDLPIAAAILVATGQMPARGLGESLLVGELGLDGSVGAVRGGVAYAALAAQSGWRLVMADGHERTIDMGCEVVPVSSISQLREGVGALSCEACAAPLGADAEKDADDVREALDYADVMDQDIPKRACVIAAAGRHGMLMVGPPGSGKTMIAHRLPTILPRLTREEQLEALLVHSVAGQTVEGILRHERPFRAPHHSISVAGLIGGGRPVQPGEVSLAHKGVLFLDEFPEFANNALQSLRQPMEDRLVRIARADGAYVFPSDFLLVAAANPCPCGYLGDPRHQCTCSEARVDRYRAKLCGPLINRIDLMVDVARPSSEKVIRGGGGTSSAQMAQQVVAAREFAAWRVGREGDGAASVGAGGASGAVDARGLGRIRMDLRAQRAFESLADRRAYGGRTITRIAQVARTIADVEQRELVSKDDIIEACAFRMQ